MSEITRSPGLTTGLGFVVGGGYTGLTNELDETVQRAAAALHDAYGMEVTIRFNSDRRSGGAWLKTHTPDGIGKNAEIGIGAFLVTQESNERLQARTGIAPKREPGAYVKAHIGRDALRSPEFANSMGYYNGTHESIADALAFVQAHGSLDHLDTA